MLTRHEVSQNNQSTNPQMGHDSVYLEYDNAYSLAYFYLYEFWTRHYLPSQWHPQSHRNNSSLYVSTAK